ncbi:MAG: TetR/AcrR family transcriptional regulator [Fimbriimonadales bacterium]
MGRHSTARERILDSSIALIHEQGYANLGVEEILSAAGVGKSSFYHFFKSKAELGEAVVNAYDQKLQQLMRSSFASTVPPLQRPIRFTQLVQQLVISNDPVLACFEGKLVGERDGVPPEMREKARAILDGVRQLILTALCEASDNRDLKPNAPLTEIADACLAYVQGMVTLYRIRNSAEPLKDLGPQIARFWEPWEA